METHTPILAPSSGKVKSRTPVLRLDPERGLCRTSKYLPLEAAKRLCQRLNNLSGILSPVVVNIRKDGKARVQWQALTPGSRLTDVAAFTAKRETTAAEQSDVMSFHATAGYLQYACLNEDGHGSPHLVDLANHECDCEDYRYRCMPLAERYGVPVPCHHLIELNRRLVSGDTLLANSRCTPIPLRRLVSAEARSARQEFVSQNLGRDF